MLGHPGRLKWRFWVRSSENLHVNRQAPPLHLPLTAAHRPTATLCLTGKSCTNSKVSFFSESLGFIFFYKRKISWYSSWFWWHKYLSYVFGTSCPLLDNGRFDVKLLFLAMCPFDIKTGFIIPLTERQPYMHLVAEWDKGQEHVNTPRAVLRFKDMGLGIFSGKLGKHKVQAMCCPFTPPAKNEVSRGWDK